MIPHGNHYWLSIVTRIGVDGADSSVDPGLGEPAWTNSILMGIDQVVAACAILLFILFWVFRIAFSGRNMFARSPKRPNHLREDSIVLVIVIYLMSVMIVNGVMRWMGEESTSLWTMLASGNAGHMIGIVACLVVVSRQFDGGVKRFFLPRDPNRMQSWWILVGLLSIVAIGLCPLITEVTLRLILWINPQYEFTPHPTIEALQAGDQSSGILAVLWIGAFVLAPIAEEIFFRGFIQTFLLGVFRSRWRAIVITSVAFGLVHLSQPYAVAALIFLAIVIGYAYETTGSILPPIMIHAVFNLKTLIWDALGDWPM